MIVTEVRVSYGRTVQPRQYESERVEVGLTASVGEDQLWVSVLTDLSRMAKERVELQLQESERARQEERRRLYHTPDYAEGEDDDSDPETTRRMGDGY